METYRVWHRDYEYSPNLNKCYVIHDNHAIDSVASDWVKTNPRLAKFNPNIVLTWGGEKPGGARVYTIKMVSEPTFRTERA